MSNLLKLLVPYVAYIGALISIINLVVNLRDRRPRLEFRQKRGKWFTKQERMLLAYYEVYNPSSRPNAIRDYRLSYRTKDGAEASLNTEECTLGEERGNLRPLCIAPYSGCQVVIAGLSELPLSSVANFQVTIVDLFEKKYEFELDLTQGVS